jgi:hypothetical protein
MISGSLRSMARKLRVGCGLARLPCRSYTCAMPTAEQYRKSADQCRRVAGNTEDRHEREALLRIAAQWDRLAEHKQRKKAEKA